MASHNLRNGVKLEAWRLKIETWRRSTSFLWKLKELLSEADPSLQENARESLLSRQFILVQHLKMHENQVFDFRSELCNTEFRF